MCRLFITLLLLLAPWVGMFAQKFEFEILILKEASSSAFDICNLTFNNGKVTVKERVPIYCRTLIKK